MNAELKKEWVANLRSGKFKQGFLRLRYDDTWCCLGVLCEIVDSQKPIVTVNNNKGSYRYGTETYYPPREIREAAGLTDNEMFNLSSLNDSERLSFKQIAKHIEENL